MKSHENSRYNYSWRYNLCDNQFYTLAQWELENAPLNFCIFFNNKQTTQCKPTSTC